MWVSSSRPCVVDTCSRNLTLFKMEQRKYSHTHRVLHWLTAVLIVVMAASGMSYYLEWSDDFALGLHQIVGQILIVVVVVRIIVRLAQRTRSVELTHERWERLLATTVHLALYAAMVVYVVTGYVAASALRDNLLTNPLALDFARSDLGEVLLETHYSMKWVLLALVTIHLSAALKHHFWDRDDTFFHIWFHKRRGPSQ